MSSSRFSVKTNKLISTGLGGDAHTIGGSLGTAKRPAAAAVGLVTDVVEDLGARWPVGDRVKGIRNADILERRTCSKGEEKVVRVSCAFHLLMFKNQPTPPQNCSGGTGTRRFGSCMMLRTFVHVGENCSMSPARIARVKYSVRFPRCPGAANVQQRRRDGQGFVCFSSFDSKTNQHPLKIAQGNGIRRFGSCIQHADVQPCCCRAKKKCN